MQRAQKEPVVSSSHLRVRKITATGAGRFAYGVPSVLIGPFLASVNDGIKEWLLEPLGPSNHTGHRRVIAPASRIQTFAVLSGTRRIGGRTSAIATYVVRGLESLYVAARPHGTLFRMER